MLEAGVSLLPENRFHCDSRDGFEVCEWVFALLCRTAAKCSDRNEIRINWMKHADKFNLRKMWRAKYVIKRCFINFFINCESGDELKLNLQRVVKASHFRSTKDEEVNALRLGVKSFNKTSLIALWKALVEVLSVTCLQIQKQERNDTSPEVSHNLQTNRNSRSLSQQMSRRRESQAINEI